MTVEPGAILSESVLQKIEAEAGKYPTRRAAVKSALRYAQAEHGWINEDVVSAVAEVLNLERIEVFEVATFYDMFYTRPVGRFPVRVCTNVSCLLRGADGIMDSLCERLDVEAGETTADGRFTVFPAECLGACGGAPMMSVADDYHENLSAEDLDAILERYR
ncbi:MAG: NADH-quinone oxidoreductase subunit NuoE [Arenicellales bacterium]|jgi:NADH-quinone oxidoreductase subunit E|nr:NADH-quinone oxidoreductase subunit NuoE [Arenicellales bacterium]MDP6551515.1 NADH-quinone oxidoreductase subunit NuoE [Arenicellales bacterium]MDP6790971.1 NADH-quinone oxidoreductase subunit NuoE [Arenicellales bacterium]MDP6918517.1 NADH-quinone oxidoreductase subunit NuoE [Arenicellales bacterium]|tara:strand:+ start:975 stop:1460 length:486 start_codon:yes stop_codon:yes gene_type:complete